MYEIIFLLFYTIGIGVSFYKMNAVLRHIPEYVRIGVYENDYEGYVLYIFMCVFWPFILFNLCIEILANKLKKFKLLYDYTDWIRTFFVFIFVFIVCVVWFIPYLIYLVLKGEIK